MVERVFYKTNDGPPAKPSRRPMVGTPPQTYRHPVPPAVRQQYPPQDPQQQPHNGPPVQYYRPAPGQYPQPVVQQQVVVQQKRGVNHAFHLIMTLITFGLWIPGGILCAIFD